MYTINIAKVMMNEFVRLKFLLVLLHRLSIVSLCFGLHWHVPMEDPFIVGLHSEKATQNCHLLFSSQEPPTRIRQRFISTSKWLIAGHLHWLAEQRRKVEAESHSASDEHFAKFFDDWGVASVALNSCVKPPMSRKMSIVVVVIIVLIASITIVVYS
jgi:hypothetical protein